MKKVFTVGIELPGGAGEYVPFDSDASLLDADVIVFQPEIPGSLDYGEQYYQGKRHFNEHASFGLKKRISHWRRELQGAVDSGKTVFVLLTAKDEVFVETGERRYSGSGRNEHTTIVVSPCSNYDVLPPGVGTVSSSGHLMVLSDQATILRKFWDSFGKISAYKVIVTGTISTPLILSKDRRHVLGGIIRVKGSTGNLVLLPDVPFSEVPGLVTRRRGKSYWTEEAAGLGQQFLQEILAIDERLKSESERTPAPTWAQERMYDLPAERKIKEKLERLEERKQALHQEEADLKERLDEEILLKGLLYEQGHALESAVIRALRLLGYKAQRFREGDSEFDVVFEAAEGRFIGEAEGKDSKPINIDKLRQLSTNLHEDHERNEVEDMAKLVLFGNAARLSAPAERKEFFTQKCSNAAKRMGCALVRTPDLFQAARYLSDSSDPEFAKLCREAILSASGETVAFPPVPKRLEKDQMAFQEV